MKKIIIFLLLASTHHLSAYSGFYVGGSLGVSTPQAAFKSTSRLFFDDAFALTDSVQLSSGERADIYRTRVWGELCTGWGTFLGPWLYAGIRLGINFASSELQSRFTANEIDNDLVGGAHFDTLVRRGRLRLWTAEYTVDFRPGYLWRCNTLFFGLLGVAINEVSLNTETTFTYVDDLPTNVTTRARAADHRTRAHFRGGLGIEQKITCRLSFIGAYTYTYYGSAKTEQRATLFHSASPPPGSTPNGLQAHASGRFYRQTVSAGVGYYF